jgi:hypothetical protein
MSSSLRWGEARRPAPFATTVHCVDDEITPCVRVHPGDKTRDYHPVALVT